LENKKKSRKLSYRKDDRATPWKFAGVPDYTSTATFPEVFNGLFFQLALLFSVAAAWRNKDV